MFEQLEQGEKRVTLRLGSKDIYPGPMHLVGAVSPQLRRLVHVQEVKYVRLCDLSASDLEGYPVQEPKALAASLRRHYPDIQDDSLVTYVRFSV